MAVILCASALPGVAERLARVSAGNKVDSSIVFRVECFHIVMDWNAWKVFRQHLLRPGIDLAESYGFDSADHPGGEGEASNATEQIQMANKTRQTNTRPS